MGQVRGRDPENGSTALSFVDQAGTHTMGPAQRCYRAGGRGAPQARYAYVRAGQTGPNPVDQSVAPTKAIIDIRVAANTDIVKGNRRGCGCVDYQTDAAAPGQIRTA